MALPNFQPYFCAEQSFGKTKPLRTKTILHYFPQHVFSNTSVKKFEKVPEVGQVNEVRALGVEENVAVFRNEFWDMYDEAFPWVKEERRRRDVEKPLLDNGELKELVEEKGKLYSRRIKGLLDERGELRLVEVNREVNRLRRRLNRE